MVETNQIIQTDAECVMQTYLRPPLVLTHGEGALLFSADNRTFLDFFAGIAVNALGHNHPAVTAAIQEQAPRLLHVSNLFHTAPQALLARQLVQHSFADRVFFCNSGTEANEGAIKFARKFGRLQAQGAQAAEKTEIIAFSGAFHGRTTGSLALTPREAYQAPFRPLLPDCRIVPFNDSAAAEAAIGPRTCAVIVEPIQGEGGVVEATPAFLATLRRLCDQHGALLIFDEIQCGIGRTGDLWAHSASGVTPDMMTLAKPLANGLPIGAILVTEAVAAAIKPGDHGSTFAGGPLVCHVAGVVLDEISRPEFLADVAAKGAILREQLARTLPESAVVAIRGRGLMVGLELRQEVAPIIRAAAGRGLLLINAGTHVLRLVPPLIITHDQIDTACGVIGELVNGGL
jgi:predicted acetylornithine/succinylornithine family transaminase